MHAHTHTHTSTSVCYAHCMHTTSAHLHMTHTHTHSEAQVEAFGAFLRAMKNNLAKMRVKFIDHCDQMSGREYLQ